jgi:DNA-binding response OmpR family regulator
MRLPTAERPPRGPLVLVVEDEPLLAMDLELTLAQHGYRVLGPAGTVAEALRLLAGETPRAALLDLNLKGEMATPVAGRLRAMGVPFMLTTAYDPARLTAAELAGAPSLGKPTSNRRLLTALAALLSTEGPPWRAE